MAKHVMTAWGLLLVPGGSFKPLPTPPSPQVTPPTPFVPNATPPSQTYGMIAEDLKEIEDLAGRRLTDAEYDEYLTISTMTDDEINRMWISDEECERINEAIKTRIRNFKLRIAPCECGATKCGSTFHSAWCPKGKV